jgi:hypothetical protein
MDAILKEHGLTRSDPVLVDYDIYIDVGPFDASSSGDRGRGQ